MPSTTNIHKVMKNNITNVHYDKYKVTLMCYLSCINETATTLLYVNGTGFELPHLLASEVVCQI